MPILKLARHTRNYNLVGAEGLLQGRGSGKEVRGGGSGNRSSETEGNGPMSHDRSKGIFCISILPCRHRRCEWLITITMVRVVCKDGDANKQTRCHR